MSTNKGGRWEARQAAWAASPKAEAHAVNTRVCFCEGQVSYRHRTFQNPGSNCQQGASEERGRKMEFSSQALLHLLSCSDRVYLSSPFQ